MDVILVNPISERGHLDAYARLYSQAFLELGYSVTLLAGQDGGTNQYLYRKNVAERAHFRFVSFAEADGVVMQQVSMTGDRRALPIYRRALLVWREEGLSGILQRLVVVPLRVVFELLPRPVQAELQLRCVAKKTAIIRWLTGNRSKISFQTHVSRLNVLLSPSQAHDSFVFFLYLDYMSESRLSVRALDVECKVPWAGILFHPGGLISAFEKFFTASTARGAAFLVPRAAKRYAGFLPHLAFHCVPDVADDELPEETPLLVRQVRERAEGRNVVLLAGSLAPHKGVMTFIDIVHIADPSRFFFVLAGEVHWQQFGAHMRRLKAVWDDPPSNLYCHEGYISDERDYNALLECCDVIYSVYEDFDSSSSNSLTKAAIFRKPVLVSAGTLMGEWVVESRIGDVAPGQNSAAILSVLERLAESSKDNFNFDAFLSRHSLDALKDSLRPALSDWCGRPATAEGCRQQELAL